MQSSEIFNFINKLDRVSQKGIFYFDFFDFLISCYFLLCLSFEICWL